MKRIRQHIALIFALLFLGGMANEVWAYKVTYHILTLPIDNNIYHLNDDFSGKRLEAVRVVDNNATTVDLPAPYKSPLAKNFKYYDFEGGKVSKSANAVAMYNYNAKNKSYYYSIEDDATDIADNAVSANMDVYVTYDYDDTKGIMLDGSVNYNIPINDGFLAFNRGRNNRLAVIPKSANRVSEADLVSEDFVNIDVSNIPGTNINPYWSGNKNPRANVGGQFHFMFQFVGSDPYNILIRTAYNKNYTYIEQHGSENYLRYKYYKDSYLFWPNSEGSGFFLASDDHKIYTQQSTGYDPNPKESVTSEARTGYFRTKGGDLVYNSFAILNNTSSNGYVFMISRYINNSGDLNTPGDYNTATYNFLTHDNNYNNLKSESRTLEYVSENYSTDEKIYLVNSYVFKVKKKISNEVLSVPVSVSEYFTSGNPLNFVPDELKRKYVTFTGAYKEKELTNEFTTFAAVDANATTEDIGGKTHKVIWLKYETNMPFETSATTATYGDLTWYNLNINKSTSNSASWDGEKINTSEGSSKYARASHFAFIGDPYELKIVGRKASDDANPSTLKYMKLATPITDNTTFDASATTWSIMYDDDTGDYKDCFRLKDNSGSNYLHQNSTTDNPLNGTASAEEAVRLAAAELPQKSYVYHIVRPDGTIAVKATGSHEPSAKLGYNTIPEIVRSPFLALEGVTLSFYSTSDDAGGSSNAVTHAPDDGTNDTQDIWVRYNMGTALNSAPGSYIKGETNFNVRLNGEYIYYSGGAILSNSAIQGNAGDNNNLWTLGGSDPYAMTVKTVSGVTNQYVTADPTEQSALGWGAEEDASKFIIKSGTSPGVYEVMYATGDDVDASTTYYHIGRDDTGTKMFQNTTYGHGYDQLRFQLTLSTAHNVTYHLIDKSNTELLTVVDRHSAEDDPEFPNEYRSPLVAEYHYYSDAARSNPVTKVNTLTDIYVTYDTSDAYDLQNKKIMYLLKYEMGTPFRAENGGDGLETDAVTPVYPYCNGDCNFFVYGQAQYDLQQQGAASTRTRWAWFLESANNDPYHVKICSRQTETYNGDQARAYFHTYKPYDYAETVTTLTWPGISGVAGTEYMILGSEGQFRLVTTYGIDLNNDGDTEDDGEDVRCTVNSFEQYWKTWDTIRKKVLGDSGAKESQTDPNTVPATPATPVATTAEKDNRTYLTDVMKWHSYEQWAYAKRWNGYNISGAKSKGWETIEHWYQTVQMGEGFFDLVPVNIDPALILLDQHGWEIMRKPLPSSADDPELEAKHAVLRSYDSPMVKEYHFWSNASKRSGFHQYYNLGRRISENGVNYSSTSLGSLPPVDATNVKDAKGNVYDQYVTYVVKDEYVQSLGEPFLIQQGSNYVSTSDGSAVTKTAVPAAGGMSQHIIDNIANLTVSGSLNTELWYLKPNTEIDTEMGYGDSAHDWTNDYTGEFSESGFDPYNIQIQSAKEYETAKYHKFVTNATGATLVEGGWQGTYTESPGISLGDEADPRKTATWYDSRQMAITNATFMAVQDGNGNIQLMSRFDHTRRMKDFTTLTTASDADTYTKLYRPVVYTYRIIDNDGNESLRYQSGGDLVPQTPDHFKSPLAKDFEYYAGIEGSTGQNEVTGSLKGATLTDNTVYVRYSYDEDADELAILQGRWLTMKLNAKDAKYDSGIKEGSDKPTSINASEKVWQWKFLKTPQSVPDPYAVQLFNRNVKDAAQPAADTRYAILSHTSGDYALAQAGLEDYTYKFLNGSGMTTSEAASLAEDKDGSNPSGFTSTSCAFNGTDSQIKLINDVIRTFNYRVYTNGGAFAVSANQDNISEDNAPTLPESIRSPLLNADQFRYYEAEADMGNEEKELKYLYGLYDDIVYVRYTAYDLKTTEYKVPNVKTTDDGKVARSEDSNDASLDINGELIYNIIWYDDNMMKRGEGDAISSEVGHDLSGDAAYVWQFEGNDPYAIKIKHKNSGKYAVGSENLAATATSTFMLLPSDEWQYGMLQVTGGTDKLSGYGQTTAASDPTKFIIFGLSTHKVIYHLVIANIGNTVNIPYRETKGGTETTTTITGSSCRDLTTTTTVTGDTYQLGSTINGLTYCVDNGHITLGDPLKVPDALERPNCKYFFYVEGVYNNEACSEANTDLNNLYKGLQITEMGTEPELLGKTVRINVEYQFDDGLPTNNGSNFVTNTTGTQWYTFETSDATPYLAHYTYKDAKLTGVEGRAGHYTNDFLWSPVGDPYGFKMYNRYVYKNGGETTKVMTTSAAPAADADLIMAVDASDNNPVYELLPGNSDGYFKVQALTIPGTGTPYYIDNTSGTMKLKTTTTTEWHFGLSDALLEPYYLSAGNVGGLTEAGKTAYEAAGDLMAKQAIVYNDENIVQFTPGYYRIFSQPNSLGITTPRYLSGYTHKTELTQAIPMHFYEREGVTTTFDVLGNGFTSTAATQGQIPIEAPEYDPASIFYITGSGPYTMQTQGLYVKENKMTETSGEATSFYVTDIGGAVVVLHDGNADIASRYYLNYDQTDANHIYDVKYTNNIGIADATKWCMEPANKKGLWIETHSGGEEAVLSTLWYYSSYCVPFDMLISNKDDDPDHSSNAYTCVEAESQWNGTMLHPKSIGKYNTGTYADNDYFVPAGTPVLFSTRRATSYIKATIPTTTPSTPISTIFSYVYLEQIISDTYDDNKRVYVFGPKMEGTFTPNTTTGEITAVLPSLGNTNVGFHINANPNKEAGLTKASWTRNNYYVLHNKIYYRAPESSPARGIEFVPVVFGEEPKTEIEGVTEHTTGNPYPGGVYNLQGRCVATEEMVQDGTWRQHLTPGIYIMGGKKVVIK